MTSTIQNGPKMVERAKSGRFLPGSRAALGHGRPRVAVDFKERCRAFMEQEGGWDKLLGLIEEGGEDRRFALKTIVAYAYGQPKESLDVNQRILVKAVSAAAWEAV